MGLSRTDREALERAIVALRRDTATREQIEAKLRDEPWQAAGEFAAYAAQCDSLGLRPWQTPPCWITDLAATLRLPFGDPRGEREAAELLRKMLNCGLSRFEPDPLAALDRVEARAARR